MKERPDWATMVAESIAVDDWRYDVAIKLRVAFEQGRAVGYKQGSDCFRKMILSELDEMRKRNPKIDQRFLHTKSGEP